jgi:hypothetical protein
MLETLPPSSATAGSAKAMNVTPRNDTIELEKRIRARTGAHIVPSFTLMQNVQRALCDAGWGVLDECPS